MPVRSSATKSTPTSFATSHVTERNCSLSSVFWFSGSAVQRFRVGRLAFLVLAQRRVTDWSDTLRCALVHTVQTAPKARAQRPAPLVPRRDWMSLMPPREMPRSWPTALASPAAERSGSPLTEAAVRAALAGGGATRQTLVQEAQQPPGNLEDLALGWCQSFLGEMEGGEP